MVVQKSTRQCQSRRSSGRRRPRRFPKLLTLTEPTLRRAFCRVALYCRPFVDDDREVDRVSDRAVLPSHVSAKGPLLGCAESVSWRLATACCVRVGLGLNARDAEDLEAVRELQELRFGVYTRPLPLRHDPRAPDLNRGCFWIDQTDRRSSPDDAPSLPAHVANIDGQRPAACDDAAER